MQVNESIGGSQRVARRQFECARDQRRLAPLFRPKGPFVRLARAEGPGPQGHTPQAPTGRPFHSRYERRTEWPGLQPSIPVRAKSPGALPLAGRTHGPLGRKRAISNSGPSRWPTTNPGQYLPTIPLFRPKGPPIHPARAAGPGLRALSYPSPNGATVPFAVRTTNRMAGPSALESGAGRVTRGVAPGWTNGWPFGPEEASTSWPLWAYRCASGQKVNSRCKNLLWPSHPGSVQSDSTGATPAIAGRGACGETCPHDSLLCRGTPVGSKESQPLPSRRIRHQKEAQ